MTSYYTGFPWMNMSPLTSMLPPPGSLSSSTQWEEDYLSQLRGEDPEEPKAEEPEEEQQEATTRPTLTSQQASDYLSQLRDFAMQQKNPELLERMKSDVSKPRTPSRLTYILFLTRKGF